jgi:hypothetical protein
MSGAQVKGRLLALLTNIRIDWKGVPGTNTLAYYKNSLVKSYPETLALAGRLARDKHSTIL